MGVELNLALLKENWFGDPNFFYYFFSESYYNSQLNKNKFLRVLTSDFLIYELFYEQIPLFDNLPNYIMQYLVTAWANK